MQIDIIHSTVDTAGVNLRAAIDDLIQHPPEGGWPLLTKHQITFRTWNERIINASDAITSPDAELVIFLARHASVNPVPVLTVHPAGNFTTADLGGSPRELGLAAPAWMRTILRNHQKYAPEGFRVSYEITHHGPTNIHVPYFFVEVGSTEAEWQNMEAIRAAATSVLMADPSEEIIPLIGFGGTHYAVRQTAIALETRGAFGHMMHTRNVAGADTEIIRQMIVKSGAIAAHVDKKAMSKSEAAHIEGLLKEIGIPEITEGDLHKIGTMPWKVWTEYLSFAKEIDPAVKLFPHGEIAATRTQDTTVEGDRITITRRQFDARLARTQGVPSGPLFGKLVAGESVTLPDGRTVTPEMVTKTVLSTIHIPGLENYS